MSATMKKLTPLIIIITVIVLSVNTYTNMMTTSSIGRDLKRKETEIIQANVNVDNSPTEEDENKENHNETTTASINGYKKEEDNNTSDDETKNTGTVTRKNRKKVMMCAIAIDEEAYIDEWVDYHHALGFDAFHIHDNSDKFELRIWGEEKGDHVKVSHLPGKAKQFEANSKCASTAKREGYVWAAFFDIDEFLQLKKHEDMVEFLEEHVSEGALGVNWILFRATKKDFIYKPFPVTKRFMYRNPNDDFNKFIKNIAKLSDLYVDNKGLISTYIHEAKLRRGTLHDTNNHPFKDPFNTNGPTDVAALHHYRTKSHKEYIMKTKRGRAGTGDIKHSFLPRAEEAYKKALDPNDNSNSIENLIYDDSAWEAMKKYVPRYALYEDIEDKKKEE